MGTDFKYVPIYKAYATFDYKIIFLKIYSYPNNKQASGLGIGLIDS